MGDLTPPQQQQLTTFLQQLQALKTPRSGMRVSVCMYVCMCSRVCMHVCVCVLV